MNVGFYKHKQAGTDLKESRRPDEENLFRDLRGKLKILIKRVRIGASKFSERHFDKEIGASNN